MGSSATLMIGDSGRAVERARAREGKQKDELCGAFCAAAAIEGVTGRRITQDAIAGAAATVLSGGAVPAVPPGETSRVDYLGRLPVAEDPATAGTSASGLVRAVQTVTGDDLAVVPLTGAWTVDAAGLLLEFAHDPDTAVILNVATRHLWPTHTNLLAVHAYLNGEAVDPGPSEWDVGHFILLLGSYTGSEGRLAVCADTYPSLGSGGMHLQPVEALAAGMNRDDDPATTGGALVVTTAGRGGSVRERATAAGLEVRAWNNGTPDADLPATSAAM